jgi:hypothetical protein
MRFIVPFFALVAATAATAQQCTVCRDSIPPGVSEIGWGLVFNRTIGDNIMFWLPVETTSFWAGSSHDVGP